MAPVLQCPDCKTKHPLDAVGDADAFPCTGCGRMLKVPESARAAKVPAATVPEPTRVIPNAVPPAPTPVPDEPVVAPPPPARATSPKPTKVAWWARLLLWLFAIPFSFFVVFITARLSGLFTHEQLTDVFLANDRARFWPLARLLPFVAVLAALIVQGGVVLLTRRRTRAQAQGSTTRGQRDASTPSTRTKAS